MTSRSCKRAWFLSLSFGCLLSASCEKAGAPVKAKDVVAAPNAVTFTRDVAPIIFSNCSSCHRSGEAAPFSLLTYDDARRRATQIVEVTKRRFMPPWQPAVGHGDFVGVRRLSGEQLETLAKWAEAGAPRGDDSDLPP